MSSAHSPYSSSARPGRLGPHPSTRKVRPRVVFDPGLPPAARQLVRAREAQGAPSRRGMEEGWLGSLAGAVLGSLVIVFGCTVVAESMFGHWFFVVAGSMAALICGCFLISFTAGYLWDRRPRLGEGRRQRTLADAEGHYILPGQLRPEAQPLVARAQAAADTVLRSKAHRNDLLDRRRNALSLPEQVWSVAENLLRYSALAERLPAVPAGSGPAEVVAKRRAALEIALRGIDQRVQRLERYAAKVVRLDAVFAELAEMERLEADSEELRDLLARVAAGNELDPELERMTDEAKVTMDAYESALVEARDAARGALLGPDAAGAGAGADA
ncbi:hypothetical protein ACEZCY_30700 [Streptacidiphilus sp. N1-12]|uniref:5-bromo-4-chloroindolyl phosphate hydrolysis protein n=2 Tax=Streptacidiphilus alkalitolerans TaxID=3342712 RepID=A0ABV6WSX6_9ACTN